MGYIILIIIAILVIRSFSKKNGSSSGQNASGTGTGARPGAARTPAGTGATEEYVSRLEAAFETVRDHYREFDTGISVMGYFVTVNGVPTGEVTKRLTVRVDMDDARCADLARQLGMRTTCYNGKYVHDLAVSGSLNKAQKNDALLRLAERIRARHPNDAVDVENGLLYDHVEMKHILDHLNRR